MTEFEERPIEQTTSEEVSIPTEAIQRIVDGYKVAYWEYMHIAWREYSTRIDYWTACEVSRTLETVLDTLGLSDEVENIKQEFRDHVQNRIHSGRVYRYSEQRRGEYIRFNYQDDPMIRQKNQFNIQSRGEFLPKTE